MLSESKFYGGYSRWREKDERYQHLTQSRGKGKL